MIWCSNSKLKLLGLWIYYRQGTNLNHLQFACGVSFLRSVHNKIKQIKVELDQPEEVSSNLHVELKKKYHL